MRRKPAGSHGNSVAVMMIMRWPEKGVAPREIVLPWRSDTQRLTQSDIVLTMSVRKRGDHPASNLREDIHIT
jgi:hypothetical protein